MALGGGGPGEVEPGEGYLVAHFDVDAAGEGGVLASDAGDVFAGGEVAEVALRQFQGVGGMEVAGDGEAGVGGAVETAEKVFDVVKAGGVQIFLGADGHPVVGVGEGEQGGLEVPVGHTVGAVFVGLAALVFDYIALDVKLALVEAVQEETHAVGFEP